MLLFLLMLLRHWRRWPILRLWILARRRRIHCLYWAVESRWGRQKVIPTFRVGIFQSGPQTNKFNRVACLVANIVKLCAPFAYTSHYTGVGSVYRIKKSGDSSVGIASGYGMDDRGVEVRVLGSAKNFLHVVHSYPLIQLVSRDFPTGIKRPRRVKPTTHLQPVPK
jgi:hypothetical protein